MAHADLPATDASRARPARTLVAFAWMGGALLSFAGLAIGIREVADTLGAFQILTVRSLVGIALVGGVVAWRGAAALHTGRLGLHALRNGVHFGGMYLWTVALSLLPLGIVTALEFTGPIWASLFAVAMLGERFTRGRLLAIAFGFLGVLVILRPGAAAIDPAALLVLGAAILYSFAHIAGKLLVRTDSALAVAFYMVLLQLPLAAIPALFAWSPILPADLPWLLLLGVSGLSAHYCLSQALARADAMTVVPFDFLRLPLMTMVGILAYDERLDPFAVLGGAVICLGIWFNLGDSSVARIARRR